MYFLPATSRASTIVLLARWRSASARLSLIRFSVCSRYSRPYAVISVTFFLICGRGMRRMRGDVAGASPLVAAELCLAGVAEWPLAPRAPPVLQLSHPGGVSSYSGSRENPAGWPRCRMASPPLSSATLRGLRSLRGIVGTGTSALPASWPRGRWSPCFECCAPRLTADSETRDS